MIDLTDRQRDTLYNLIKGDPSKVDGRTVAALRRRWLVNKHGQATTAGWHAIGEWRWMPHVKIPEDWEIDTWKGQILHVYEGPKETGFDADTGEELWHIADKKDYYFDLYSIMKFYQACKVAEQECLLTRWNRYYDRESAPDRESRTRDSLATEARLNSETSVATEMNLYYVGDMLYKWAMSLYKYREISRHVSGLITSYKYSFQDNEDEHKRLQITPKADDVISFYAEVGVD